jgi:hypothetical protein
VVRDHGEFNSGQIEKLEVQKVLSKVSAVFFLCSLSRKLKSETKIMFQILSSETSSGCIAAEKYIYINLY